MRRPYIPHNNLLLTQGHHQLYQLSCHLINIPPLNIVFDNLCQVDLRVLHYAIKRTLLTDNLLNLGDVLAFGVFAKGEGFALEDFLPSEGFVELFHDEYLA